MLDPYEQDRRATALKTLAGPGRTAHVVGAIPLWIVDPMALVILRRRRVATLNGATVPDSSSECHLDDSLPAERSLDSADVPCELGDTPGGGHTQIPTLEPDLPFARERIQAGIGFRQRTLKPPKSACPTPGASCVFGPAASLTATLHGSRRIGRRVLEEVHVPLMPLTLLLKPVLESRLDQTS
jgi:hypothetical protein